MNFYNFEIEKTNGEILKTSTLKGKVVLVVNTASACGFKSQINELEDLYKKYKDLDFEIIGFPCNQFGNQEHISNEEIENSYKKNFGVSFIMSKKIKVKGENSHALFKYLTENTKGVINSEIKWNFTKFLIDKEGNVVERYSPMLRPTSFEVEVLKYLVKR